MLRELHLPHFQPARESFTLAEEDFVTFPDASVWRLEFEPNDPRGFEPSTRSVLGEAAAETFLDPLS